jgi:hypothetical protein
MWNLSLKMRQFGAHSLMLTRSGLSIVSRFWVPGPVLRMRSCLLLGGDDHALAQPSLGLHGAVYLLLGSTGSNASSQLLSRHCRLRERSLPMGRLSRQLACYVGYHCPKLAGVPPRWGGVRCLSRGRGGHAGGARRPRHWTSDSPPLRRFFKWCALVLIV